jgi:Domain of unknown function (DUF4440)
VIPADLGIGRPRHVSRILRSVTHRRPDETDSDAEVVRNTERDRVDVDAARQLHSDEFQLVTPEGEVLSKEQYLGAIASGALRYLVFEPGPIAVRLHGDAAIIRYRSEIEVVVDGSRFPRHPLWHTDSYERRDGR